MTYEQWHKKYIESNSKALLEEKKWKNRHTDQKQYERYKEVLGKEYLPISFDELTNLKYSDKDEYGVLKA